MSIGAGGPLLLYLLSKLAWYWSSLDSSYFSYKTGVLIVSSVFKNVLLNGTLSICSTRLVRGDSYISLALAELFFLLFFDDSYSRTMFEFYELCPSFLLFWLEFLPFLRPGLICSLSVTFLLFWCDSRSSALSILL